MPCRSRDAAFAVGGSARALKRLESPQLGPAELEQAIELLTGTATGVVSMTYGIDEQRARTLLAGALILSAFQTSLGVPLEVVRGGLRDGALAELAAGRIAA